MVRPVDVDDTNTVESRLHNEISIALGVGNAQEVLVLFAKQMRIGIDALGKRGVRNDSEALLSRVDELIAELKGGFHDEGVTTNFFQPPSEG